MVRSPQKKKNPVRKGIATCASYTSDEQPGYWAKRQVQHHLLHQLLWKCRPTLYRLTSMAYLSKTCSIIVCSCDSWWVIGTSLQASLMCLSPWDLYHRVFLMASSSARGALVIAKYSGSHSQVPPSREGSPCGRPSKHPVLQDRALQCSKPYMWGHP